MNQQAQHEAWKARQQSAQMNIPPNYEGIPIDQLQQQQLKDDSVSITYFCVFLIKSDVIQFTISKLSSAAKYFAAASKYGPSKGRLPKLLTKVKTTKKTTFIKKPL